LHASFSTDAGPIIPATTTDLSTEILMADTKDTMGHTMAQGSEKGCGTGTANKECGTASSKIQERMDVIASCGKKVGVVDHIEGETLKLTKSDSPDGQHHFIPVGWVDHVDTHVHLKKNSQETEQGWKSDAAGCAACGG